MERAARLWTPDRSIIIPSRRPWIPRRVRLPRLPRPDLPFDPEPWKCAITQFPLASNSDSTDRFPADDYITLSQTPTSGRLQVGTIISDALDPAPTISGNSLTWVEALTVAMTGAAGCRLTVFRAMGTPTAGVVNIANAAHQAGCIWSFSEYAGVDTGGTNGSAAVRNPTAGPETSVVPPAVFSITLPAFGSVNNGVYAAFAINSNTPGGLVTLVPGPGFTQVHQLGHGAPGRGMLTQWRNDNDTSVDASEDSETLLWVGIALELVAAVTGVGGSHELTMLGVGG